jgi:hypothetical protein
MARKIERFDQIYDVRAALRWLKKQDGDISRDDARTLVDPTSPNGFPDDFAITGRYFEKDDGNADSLIGISNWRSWNREFEDTLGKHWWTVDGGPVVLVLTRTKDGETPEGEALQGLENYPVFDENDHSDLEQETQAKDWTEYGRADLRSEIIRRAAYIDSDAIEELMNNVDDKMLDELAYDYYERSGHYPEIEGTSTNFPDAIEDWDGTLMELGERLALSRHGFVVEITLSRAAFDQRGRIVLRKQDLPDEVADLVNHPDPIQVKYKGGLCNNPYLTCRWTGAKEIETRQKQRDEDVGQMRLPIEERRRKHAHRHA